MTGEPGDQTRPHSTGLPARGYSWPPFEKGNTAALTAGHNSPRKVQPIADALTDEITSAAPWCASPAFRGAVGSWAWSEAQATLLRAYVEEHGMIDDEGEERPAVRTLDRVEGRLAKLRDQLGLSPAALGKLMQSAASVAATTGDQASVDALRAEGSRILASRLTATEPDPDGDQP